MPSSHDQQPWKPHAFSLESAMAFSVFLTTLGDGAASLPQDELCPRHDIDFVFLSAEFKKLIEPALLLV